MPLLLGHLAWELDKKTRLERVQKRALKITLGPSFTDYHQALDSHNLFPLAVPKDQNHSEKTIYHQALIRFGYKLFNHPYYSQYFLGGRLSAPHHNLRYPKIVKEISAKRDRYRLSPLPSIAKALNDEEKRKKKEIDNRNLAAN